MPHPEHTMIPTPQAFAAKVARDLAASTTRPASTRIPAPGKKREFTPHFEECPDHGRFQQNELDERGGERWRPGCPACRRQHAIQTAMQRTAIAPRFAHCRFGNFSAVTGEQRDVLATCQSYAKNFNRVLVAGTWLALLGNPGTGKNHLAVAITHEVLGTGKSALHATATEIIQRMRSTWGNRSGGETEDAVLRALVGVDLLVIDEVGRSMGTESEKNLLFQVIDGRYRGCKPGILISNLDRDGLRETLGTAAFDRLREGGGKVLHFGWESYRGKETK